MADVQTVAQPAAQVAVEQGLGFAHFLAQTDAVGRFLLVVLVLMSVVSWVVIGLRAWSTWQQQRRSGQFLQQFWQARSLDEVDARLREAGVRDPFAHVSAQALDARRHHQRYGATSLADAGSLHDFVTRSLRKTLDEQGMRLERGLSTLATVGATAPFVGLFGTVWGVYHALTAIGMSGAGTLDKVAGPVGEALIMTGLGLAVAIPAVVAYNAISRGNRVLNARLDSFAFEVLTLVTTGRALAGAATSDAPQRAPLAGAKSSQADSQHAVPTAAAGLRAVS